MKNLGLILGFIAVPIEWVWIVRATRTKGWWRVASHGMGALMMFPTIFSIFVVVSDPGWPALVMLALYVGTLYIIIRPRGEGVVVPPTRRQIIVVPKPVQTEAVVAARGQSLDALRRATEARRYDKDARGEHDAVPLSGWSPTGAATSYLTEIEFDYVDARGKASYRRVSVEAVDVEYLEGFCHETLATRTFVVGRVRGKVLDCDTGELLAPKLWAAQMRRDPRNSKVTMGGERKRDDAEAEPEYDADKILFTGFSKDQRSELEALAEAVGMTVRKSVTQGLSYVCAGPNAGPSKLDQAEAAGVTIIDIDTFMAIAGD